MKLYLVEGGDFLMDDIRERMCNNYCGFGVKFGAGKDIACKHCPLNELPKSNYQVADCLKAIGAFIMDNAEDVANSIDLNKTTEIKIHGSVDASGLPEVSFEQVSPVLLQQYIKKNESSDGR